MTTELHINPTDPLDVAFWALIFDVGEAAVLEAIEEVGDNSADVSLYLRTPALHRHQFCARGD